MGEDQPQSQSPRRKYSARCPRPFRLQLSVSAASGFAAPASRGRCQAPGCVRFEWCNGAKYCRECWLRVYQQEHLPERSV